jgi:hypothetical protein
MTRCGDLRTWLIDSHRLFSEETLLLRPINNQRPKPQAARAGSFLKAVQARDP